MFVLQTFQAAKPHIIRVVVGADPYIQAPSGRELDFAKQKTEGECEAQLACAELHVEKPHITYRR